MAIDALTSRVLALILGIALVLQGVPALAKVCACQSGGCAVATVQGPEAFPDQDAERPCCSQSRPESAPDDEPGSDEGCCEGACRCSFCGVSASTPLVITGDADVRSFERQIGLLLERAQSLSPRDAALKLIRPPKA